MARFHIFADEAGCFEFSRNGRASKYFILCTVRMEHCSIGDELLELRRKMIWDGLPVGEYFHATEDKQAIRDAVFNLMAGHKIDVHATIMEKSKALPRVRTSHARFYQHGWLYHFRHGALTGIPKGSELLITAASIGTQKKQTAFSDAVKDVASQTIQGSKWKTFFCRAIADPGLQIADYCAWALQRKWERNDTRSHNLIKHHIRYEYDLWQKGTVHHY